MNIEQALKEIMSESYENCQNDNVSIALSSAAINHKAHEILRILRDKKLKDILEIDIYKG